MAVWTQTPTERLDYAFDWSLRMADEDDLITGLVDNVLIVEEGITVSDIIVAHPFVWFYVTGGEVGRTYTVTCKATTDAGKTPEWSEDITMVAQHRNSRR